MPFTKENLMTLYSLSPEDVDQTLTAAKLPLDKSTYEDDEISSGFEVIRNYFNNGQAGDYTAAAELFNQHQASFDSGIEQQPKNKRAAKGKKSGATDNEHIEPCDRLNVLELIALATKNCGVSVELLQAIQIMPLCGLLPNQSDFAPDECDRFLEACSMLLKQNKSHQEVAAYFGAGATDTDGDIEVQVEQTATNLDQSGNGIVSEIMRSKAKADASAAASMYLQHLSNEFGSPEFQAAWQQMESALKARVMGKSQQRARQLLGEMRMIPPSTSPLNTLPEASDNGSTTN